MADVVIWGAGAIGGTIGAYLARAGKDVLFVDIDEPHVAEIRAKRLKISGPVDTFVTGGPAVTPAQMSGSHPLIFLAVKAHHTESATRALAPFLASDGAVVSCQNGLNELVIADIVGRNRTIGAFVNFMADYQSPGHILYGGHGAVVLGELDGRRTERVARIHQLLKLFEPEAIVTDNIFGYLWGKAAYGTMLKTSAMADESITGFLLNPKWKHATVSLIQEVLRVAVAEGVRTIGFDGFVPAPFIARDQAGIDASLHALVEHNGGTAKTHSGVWRDIVIRKRPTDVAAQLGPVQSAGKRLGLPTPLVDWVIAKIADVDAGRRSVGQELISELGELAEKTNASGDQAAPSSGAAKSKASTENVRITAAQHEISARLPPETPPWTWSEDVWRRAVDHVRAGRALKPQRWKDGARFAVAVSFDADHETIELRNGGRSYSKLSQGQQGSRTGLPRILSTLQRHAIPASFFMPAVAAMLNERDVASITDGGHEIGIHSWIHEFNSRLDYQTERDLAFRASDTLTRLSGRRPVGMRTASWDFSPWTLKIIRELGLIYDSSLMADTEPYELLDAGEPTGIVEIPVEWIRDDAVYFSMDRLNPLRPYTAPSTFLEILLRELDAAEEEGGLFQLTMHPHHIGHRSRIFVLDEVLKAARSKKSVWFATHAEIATYCAAELREHR